MNAAIFGFDVRGRSPHTTGYFTVSLDLTNEVIDVSIFQLILAVFLMWSVCRSPSIAIQYQSSKMTTYAGNVADCLLARSQGTTWAQVESTSNLLSRVEDSHGCGQVQELHLEPMRRATKKVICGGC